MACDGRPGGASRSLAAAAALPALAASAAAASALFLSGCSGGSNAVTPPATTAAPATTATQPAPKATLEDALAACDNSGDYAATRACYARTLVRDVGATRNPRAIIKRLADLAWSDPSGFLLPNCHGMMHTVGRTYAVRHHVKLATLMNYLPQANDPGCSAGFAHGLISGVAGQIDARHPKRSEAVCNRARTRYEQYSCIHGFGHAFMRLYGEHLVPALRLCRELGPAAASDCSGGAFHDYWFSVGGYDNTKAAVANPVTDPRKLCGAQPSEFVLTCWYRAFVDNRPPGYQTRTAADILRLCTGLRGIQRSGCVTASSVIGPADPVDQLSICADLRPADAVSCVHGTKVQNLLNYPISTHVDTIRHCDLFRGATRIACYQWLGKTIAVLTNGRFRTAGCPLLEPDARSACLEGARSMNTPLVTFS